MIHERIIDGRMKVRDIDMMLREQGFTLLDIVLRDGETLAVVRYTREES